MRLTVQIQQDSSNGELYLKRGELYRQHTDWSQAQTDFWHALSLDEDLVDAHLGLARTYAELQMSDSGLDHVNAFLSHYTYHPPKAIRVRAHLLIQAERYEEALLDLEVVVASRILKPEDIVALAQTQLQIHPTSYNEALATIDHGLTRVDGAISLYEAGLSIATEGGAYERALYYVDEVLSVVPDNPHWLAKRGHVCAQAGNHTEATSAFEHALRSISQLPQQTKATLAIRQLRSSIEAELRRIKFQLAGR